VEFFLEYAGFLLRVLTVVVALAVVAALMAGARMRGKDGQGSLQVRSLNEFYQELKDSLQEQLLDKKQLKELRKQDKAKARADKEQSGQPRVFVLDFDGDIKASATAGLRHEITAVLALATAQDEVVVRLESGGGMVHSYGLAASQLARIREAGIPLTVCVDKVAASGGYMMACIGNKILSAPFAVLGSVGVVAQVPNIHKLLKKNDIDVEVLTAGEYKRTLTILGENTREGREKFLQDLQTTHDLFKEFVSRYRPQLDMQKVATGEVWLGTRAFDLQLVDSLQTSDAYLAERAKNARLFALDFSHKKTLPERFGMASAQAADSFLIRWWEKLVAGQFWR